MQASSRAPRKLKKSAAVAPAAEASAGTPVQPAAAQALGAPAARKRTPKRAQTLHASPLEALLNYRFQRPELLERAMTHRSFAFDSGQVAEPAPASSNATEQDNEQLEFLGDAVLGMLAAESLAVRFPGSREGDLTRMRSSVVSRRYLGEVGARLQFGQWLRLGHTAERNGGRENTTLFANAIEAVIAALYLDGGLEAARAFVEREILWPAVPALELSADAAVLQRISGSVGDHKTALQEFLQARGRGRPDYRLLSESGPPHSRTFLVEVRLLPTPGSAAGEASTLAEAAGPSKKRAQQEAARLALLLLESAAESQASDLETANANEGQPSR